MRGGLSIPSEPEDADEAARERLTEFQRFLTRVWESGFGGKLGLSLLYVAFALPVLFDILAIVVVWVWIWPLAVGVAEKMAVISFLFIVLNVVALQVKSTANNLLVGIFLTRRRRRRKSGL